MSLGDRIGYLKAHVNTKAPLMRRDKHLPALVPKLALTEAQVFFLNCWFNLVHESSLDSYRVRVMNPESILRELLKMYEPHADESDRKRVAEEAVEILRSHPIFERSEYEIVATAAELLSDAIKGKVGASSEKQEGEGKGQPFTKNSVLIKSYISEIIEILSTRFINDCFALLVEIFEREAEGQLTVTQTRETYRLIRRVTRDLVSTALDGGSSLESLFQHYRGLLKQETNHGTQTASASQFLVRLEILKSHLTAAPKNHKLVFVLNGVARPQHYPLRIDDLAFSPTPPEPLGKNPLEVKFLQPNQSRLFVTTEVEARDGRSAGMTAYRRISEILDLVRFEYDKVTIVQLRSNFLLQDSEQSRLLLGIPRVIPNPDDELPPQQLEEFVHYLNRLVTREEMQPETKERILSAFRLYRVGADADIFENKLINWWTGLEYLAKGSKSSGGPIGAGVEAALVPAISLAYIPKHLGAFRAVLKEKGAKLTSADGTEQVIGSMPIKEFYLALREQKNKAAFEVICSDDPYLWLHLGEFIDSISTPKGLGSIIKRHEQRLRWQIQRIYRARCDVVHSARQVANAGLLCANLEFYLKTTLNSMLIAFQGVATLKSPHEFFERCRYRHERILAQLDDKTPCDDLLVRSLPS